MRYTATDFLHDIMGQKLDENALKEKLCAALKVYGFENFIYSIANAETTEYITHNTVSSDWMHKYLSEGLYNFDYAAHYCIFNSAPLAWSDMNVLDNKGMLARESSRVLSLARDFSIAKGYTIPLQKPGPFFAGISIIADKNINQKEINENFHKHYNEIRYILEIFHSYVDLSQNAKMHYKLTPREVEMLKWLADGKFVNTIPFQTNTALSTIEKQIRSMRQKLNAATNTQAVAKAVWLGII